jgi:type IV pilus assembly protein PilO
MKLSNYDIKNIYEWPIFVRLSLFCIISILIFYIGFLLDILKLRDYIHSSQIQQGELLNQFKTLINDKIIIKNNISQLPELKQLLSQWEKAMVTSEEIPIILDEIIKTISEDHLQLNLLDPKNEVKDTFYYKIPVVLQMSGTFDEIASFLSQISNMSKIVEIDNFTITKEHDNTASSTENKLMTANNINHIELTLNLYKK